MEKKWKDGVQLIASPGKLFVPNPEILLVRDFNDRGRGDGKRLYGLPGGGINHLEEESPEDALIRESYEEGRIVFPSLPTLYGTFPKERPGGEINQNHLFFIEDFSQVEDHLFFSDPLKEVSVRTTKRLNEILHLFHSGLFHEGSLRLVLHLLMGTTGSLNEKVVFRGRTY